jgi:5-hydroxyisourate hydrolase
MSRVSTHVLDTAHGRPAAGVTVFFDQCNDRGEWMELARAATNVEGRVPSLLTDDTVLERGTYRLRFATGNYFLSLGMPRFYPEVHVLVSLDDPAAHYHIPLLISPYGYSTYRGS